MTSVRLARHSLPVTMASDEVMLRSVMTDVAIENGCDAESIRNITTRIVEGDVRMLVVEADADRRDATPG